MKFNIDLGDNAFILFEFCAIRRYQAIGDLNTQDVSEFIKTLVLRNLRSETSIAFKRYSRQDKGAVPVAFRMPNLPAARNEDPKQYYQRLCRIIDEAEADILKACGKEAAAKYREESEKDMIQWRHFLGIEEFFVEPQESVNNLKKKEARDA